MDRPDVARLMTQLERVAEALERMGPRRVATPDFDAADCFVWNADELALDPVRKVSRVAIGLIKGVDRVRDILLENTQRFAVGHSANNVLLWGGLHRNTYLNSPTLLDGSLQLKSRPGLRFAGQITGWEGYVESAAIGLLAGRFAAAERLGQPLPVPPLTTAFGALLNHITGGHIVSDEEPGKRSFQPMNVNFGLFPPIEEPKSDGKRLRGKEKTNAKRRAITARALVDAREWLGVAPAREAAE